LVEKRKYYKNGELGSRQERKYDAKGNHIERIYYNFDGTVTARYVYQYAYLDLTPKQYAEYTKVIKKYPSIFE